MKLASNKLLRLWHFVSVLAYNFWISRSIFVRVNYIRILAKLLCFTCDTVLIELPVDDWSKVTTPLQNQWKGQQRTGTYRATLPAQSIPLCRQCRISGRRTSDPATSRIAAQIFSFPGLSPLESRKNIPVLTKYFNLPSIFFLLLFLFSNNNVNLVI